MDIYVVFPKEPSYIQGCRTLPSSPGGNSFFFGNHFQDLHLYRWDFNPSHEDGFWHWANPQ